MKRLIFSKQSDATADTLRETLEHRYTLGGILEGREKFGSPDYLRVVVWEATLYWVTEQGVGHPLRTVHDIVVGSVDELCGVYDDLERETGTYGYESGSFMVLFTPYLND